MEEVKLEQPEQPVKQPGSDTSAPQERAVKFAERQDNAAHPSTTQRHFEKSKGGSTLFSVGGFSQ
jgi:hypothetical protein